MAAARTQVEKLSDNPERQRREEIVTYVYTNIRLIDDMSVQKIRSRFSIEKMSLISGGFCLDQVLSQWLMSLGGNF